MKYIVICALMLTLVAPAFADDAAPITPVLAKTTAAQRATTELVSARIRAALDGQPYSLDPTCTGKGCDISSK